MPSELPAGARLKTRHAPCNGHRFFPTARSTIIERASRTATLDTTPPPQVDRLPDITRPDVAVVTVTHRKATSETEQRARADALIDATARTPPHGLLTVSCFVSIGSSTNPGYVRATQDDKPRRSEELDVMTYEQWGDGGEASQAGEPYRLYRSHVNAAPPDAAQGPRCVVIVTIDFNAPDQQRLRQWIDGVVAALEAEPSAIPGMIAGHFHTNLAGNRVLNYAEWTSERAYDDALATGPAGIGQTDLPEWRRVREFPGVTGNPLMRYALDRAIDIVPPAADSSADSKEPLAIL
jgi:hypothetical protein